MRYDPERTLKHYENYKGGINNLLVLQTNPVGISTFALREDTVITTGSRNHEDTMRRHRRKLAQLNREATR